jgi:hypothetical protein
MRTSYFPWPVAAALALATGSPAASGPADPAPLPAFVLKKTGQFIAQSRWNQAALYTLRDGAPVRVFTADDQLDALAVSLDETRLLAACREGLVHVWNISSGELVCSLRRWLRRGAVAADVAFAADGKSFVVASRAGQLLIHDTESGRLVRQFRLAEGLRSAALRPDGSGGVAVTGQNRFFEFNISGELRELKITGAGPVRYSASGKYLVFRDNDGSADQHLLLWRTAGDRTFDLGRFGRVGRIEPDAGGNYLLTSEADGRAVGHQIQCGERTAVRVWRLPDSGGLGGMAFDPARLRGVSTLDGHRTAVYDLRRGTVLYAIDHPDFAKPSFGFREWAFVGTTLVALVVTCLLVPLWFWRKARANNLRGNACNGASSG